ncbi:TetR/AcrR family transcriptional regulator [Pseudoalteromonas fenneropenaei]|uniref:TetR/AcrR family transcriptional regulator n=1 Tax=Pseudoalteromonas fenneropenaei TaxID=1737459 RepID=A0ABV7CFI4_9GAMM
MNKREKTRSIILLSSWRLFAEQGYQETTTRQIAELAGVATGTVFSHFPTKLDILKTAMLEHISDVIAQAAQTDTQHSPRLKLRHYASYLYRFYLENREFSKELLGGLIWQQSFFSAQLESFKQRLFAEQQYEQTKADVMMDLYFMTLLQGLNDDAINAEQLVRILSQKLQQLG